MEECSSLEASSPGRSNAGASEGITGTINLRPPGRFLAVDLTDQVHLLPCSMKHDGPCPVSHYFKPQKTDVAVDDLCVEQAFFRGRKLQGVTIPLPEGYGGHILEKKKPKSRKGLETPEEWVSRAEFGNLTYWNHDSLPSPDDPLLRCFHWFSVANALHRRVTEEELVSATSIQGRND